MIGWVFKSTGGKSKLRKLIIPLFPVHTYYIELLAGAGRMLFGIPHSAIKVMNSTEAETTKFFRVAMHDPDAINLSFSFEPVARSEFSFPAKIEP
jgi:DNA adenine methylase